MDKQLTDDQISSILDGEADPELLERVAQSPEAAARVEQARNMEYQLRTSLYRWDCLTSQQLRDYHMRFTDHDETRKIGAHLTECVLCKKELIELETFLEQGKPAPAPKKPQRLINWLKAIVLQPIALDTASAMRGEPGTSQVFEANGIPVVVDTRPAGDDQVEVIGQVAADDVDPWVGALVELRQQGAVIKVTTVDEIGGFSCAPVPVNKTELCITPQSQTPILISEIDLTP
ncbi:MAG: hypothetical protein AAGF95_12255 [Chloroflexota bacterium]